MLNKTFWTAQLATIPPEIIQGWISALHPDATDLRFVEGETLGHYVWSSGTAHCSVDLSDPPAWLVLKVWEHLQGQVTCHGCNAADPLFGFAETKRQAEQSGINARWLIGQVDAAHSLLCPGKIGTWQQRAQQLVTKAGEISS